MAQKHAKHSYMAVIHRCGRSRRHRCRASPARHQRHDDDDARHACLGAILLFPLPLRPSSDVQQYLVDISRSEHAHEPPDRLLPPRHTQPILSHNHPRFTRRDELVFPTINEHISKRNKKVRVALCPLDSVSRSVALIMTHFGMGCHSSSSTTTQHTAKCARLPKSRVRMPQNYPILSHSLSSHSHPRVMHSTGTIRVGRGKRSLRFTQRPACA